MKLALYILSALLIFTGFIWFLQGLNVLLGSFMSGQAQWAIIGAISIVVGIVLASWNRRRG